MNKLVLLFCVLFLPFMSFGQIPDTIVDITEKCEISREGDAPFIIKFENSTLITGVKGDYSILKVQKNDQFLNAYCLSKVVNAVTILTAHKQNDEWKHYGTYFVLPPHRNATIREVRYPDIHTFYIVFETPDKNITSVIYRLTERGYAVYEYLNDPYGTDDAFIIRDEDKIKGRPRF